MWSRSVAAVALFLGVSTLSFADNTRVYTRALPPDKAALERLNLRIEWTLYLPVEGRRGRAIESPCRSCELQSQPRW